MPQKRLAAQEKAMILLVAATKSKLLRNSLLPQKKMYISLAIPFLSN